MPQHARIEAANGNALAAQAEDVPVMGTVWLLRTMVENQLLSVDEAIAALALMKEGKQRLALDSGERILNGLREGA